MDEQEEASQWLSGAGILALFSAAVAALGAAATFLYFRRRAPELSDGAVGRLAGASLAGRRAAAEITEFGRLRQSTIDALPRAPGGAAGAYNYAIIVEVPDSELDVPTHITITVPGGSEMTAEELDAAIRAEANAILARYGMRLADDQALAFIVRGVFRG